MLKNLLIYIGIISSLIGCAQTPQPVGHQFSTQKKRQASAHWQALANDIGNNIVDKIGTGATINFIPNNNSAFCRGFRSFLTTDMVNAGVTPASFDMAEFNLDWSVQIVSHEGLREKSQYPKGTLFAALGYGVYKLLDSNSSSLLAAIGTGAALDLAEQIYRIDAITLPKNEIILNVS